MQPYVHTLIAVLLMGLTQSADAAFVTYLGFDAKASNPPSNQFNLIRANAVNSLAAYNSFVSGLGPGAEIGIEDFESFAGSPPANSAGSNISLHLQFDRILPLTGALPVHATLNGIGQIAQITDPSLTSNGRYPVLVPGGGSQYFDTNFIDLTFTIDFGSTAVDALGFFATDVGDHNGHISLGITYADSTFENYAISHPFTPTTGFSTDLEHGSLIFFGLNSDKAIKSVTFTNLQPAEEDRFGFDTLVVSLSAVPEPSSLLLVLTGMFSGGIHVLRWRRALG